MSDAPLATFALLCFNQERFVAEAIRSALAQDYSPLEILISDDASTDGTWTIIERLAADYRGPHRLRLNRNDTNLGVGAHTDKIGSMAQGVIVLLAAGDDIDLPDRVSRVMAEYVASCGKVTAISAPSIMIDEAGREVGTMTPTPTPSDLSLRSFALTGHPFIGPAAYSRCVFTEFGPMGSEVLAGEDLVLPLRAALLGELRVLASPVSFYRQHGSSLMGGAGGRAPSAADFARGMRRFLRGAAAARQVQLRDFRAFVAAAGAAIDADGEIERTLIARAHRDGAMAAMAAGRWSGMVGMLKCRLAGQLSWREFLKAVVMTMTPALWYRYLRRPRDRAMST